MDNFLIRKLECFARLSAEDKRFLARATGERVRRIPAREDVIREGERPRDAIVVLDGWACRYKTLEDGRRQVIALFVPGDVCDLNVFLLRQMDHSIGALTPMTIAEIPHEILQEVVADHPRVAQALAWESLVSGAIQREWTVNLGQRAAFERLGHLLCELFLRLRAVGLANGATCDLPITQSEIADATGLSTVHVNRTLQELRGSGLISLRGRELGIPDLAALRRASFFNAGYLHLDREGRHFDADDGRGATE